MNSNNDGAAVIEITAGIDVGNGYVKGVLRNETTGVVDEVDMPSAVVSTSSPLPKVPLDDTQAVERVVDEDFFNVVEASFTTPLVRMADRRILGRAALSVRGSKFTEFEVIGSRSKSDQELSRVLVLGVVAAKALRDHVRATGALPRTELRVRACLGLALPIVEYETRRHAYAAEYTGPAGSSDELVHLVTIKNFATPVTVRIELADVQVTAEGASAQYAITEKGESLAEALLADLRRRDPSLVPGVTAADLVAVRNTIGVDVGEGTVNFPVFTSIRFNSEASRTLQEGYGTVLMNAMARMENARPPLVFTSRKQLADFLQTSPSVLQRSKHDRAAGFVDTEAGYLVDEIVQSFGEVLSQVEALTEVVYVYGGGSGPLKELLHPALLQAARGIPVLYLDASYSRHLNREGLYLTARFARDRLGNGDKGGIAKITRPASGRTRKAA